MGWCTYPMCAQFCACDGVQYSPYYREQKMNAVCYWPDCAKEPQYTLWHWGSRVASCQDHLHDTCLHHPGAPMDERNKDGTFYRKMFLERIKEL